jgi:hypothetical protein
MPLSPEERDSLRPAAGQRAVIVHTGGLLEITYVTKDRKKRVSKRRGTVGAFSRASRLRLMRTCSTVDWESALPAVFVTLTYPDDRVVTSGPVRTLERDAMFRAIESYLGKQIPVLWRTEWKPRLTGKLKGSCAPHVHLIVMGCSFISYSAVNAKWCSVLGADGYVRTDIRKIRTPEAAGRYVSKYCAKLPDDLSLVNTSKISVEGRHWGIHRRELLQLFDRNIMCNVPPELISLAENGACRVFPHFTRGARQGFSLFGDVAKKLGEEIFLRAIAMTKRK